jgi:RND family efflux transporter MFP subunit
MNTTKTITLCTLLLFSQLSIAEDFLAPVQVVNAVEEEMAPIIWISGTVMGRHDSLIAVEVEGIINEIVEVGDRLEQGDILARVDPVIYELKVQEAEAEILPIEARLDFYKKEGERLTTLAQQNNAAKNRLDEVRADYGEAKGKLRVAWSRLAQARDLLKRTKILAPFPGVVAERYKSDGEHVTPGDEVLRLVNTESLEIQARTPQYTVPFIRQHGELIVVDGKKQNISKVRAMVPVGDKLSRLYEVRLEFFDPEWMSGHAVRVAIPVDASRTVLAVPRDALVIREEGISVFRIIDGETAELVPVTTGISNDDLIEIKGSIKPGDQVVVRGNERLQPGQKVIIKQGQVAK